MNWFKNLKIKTKIVVGFSIVIIMVVIIAASAVVSNNSITGATHEVKIYNEINDAIAGTNDNFFSARIHATKFNIRYSAEVWDSFASAFAEVNKSKDKGMSIINANPILSEYQTVWKQTIDVINEYYASMENVRKAYIEAESAKNTLIAIGPEIVSGVNEMYQAQMRGTRNQIDAGDPPEELNIKMDRISDTIEIDKLVAVMRIGVTKILENYTNENVAAMKADITAVRDKMKQYYSILRTQASMDVAQSAMDKLDEYEKQIDIFVKEQEIVTSERLKSERLGEETISKLNEKAASFQASLTLVIDDAESVAGTARLIVLLITAAAVAISVFIALYISALINTPLIKATDLLREVSDSISSASGQLLSASTSLAEASSEQAASIEETSATMNETSSMISQNAENTRVATQIAAAAMAEVNEAGKHMGMLMETMNELKESSDRVSKIVKTIDGIAFQTNLLAINATVEAARAGGDAGRSFAVVAQEVRNLAQRSADSSKETAEIIEKNISLTDSSKSSAERVGVIAGKNAKNLADLDKLISEISAASDEQSSGVKQVNIAMSHIEKATQANAAVAEQSAAATNELKNQTENLLAVYEDIKSLIEGIKT